MLVSFLQGQVQQCFLNQTSLITALQWTTEAGQHNKIYYNILKEKVAFLIVDKQKSGKAKVNRAFQLVILLRLRKQNSFFLHFPSEIH